jgi:hypothetical protein
MIVEASRTLLARITMYFGRGFSVLPDSWLALTAHLITLHPIGFSNASPKE